MKGFIFKEQTMLMKYCKIFCIYSALLMVMLGIWVDVGIAQSDWMPDETLRGRVLSRLKALNIVDSTATTFTKENLADTGFTRLGATNRDISNLTGLKYATSLTDLQLANNQIRDISALSSLTELDTLTLDSNQIHDISPLSGLSKLRALLIHDNPIYDTKKNIAALTSLTALTFISMGQGTGAIIANDNKLPLIQQARAGDNSGLRALLFTPPPLASPSVRSTDSSSKLIFTFRFDERVTGFQKDDITVETELKTGTGIATLETLTPTTEPEQTYIATIRLPANAEGTVRIILHAQAVENNIGVGTPTEDKVYGPIAFTTIPVRKVIIQQCPVGWVRSDRFGGPTQRVLLHEVKLKMDLQNRISIYKPDYVAIYVHPDEGLENLDGWKLQVAVPYNHHRDYLLTAENSVVVDANIEGVEGGFAFIENPEEDPFPMVGMGFTGALVPGFDYRLYDDKGRKVDFGIACYKQGGIFQALKDMEDPRVLRNVLLETLDWDSAIYIRSEWRVPVPAPAAPSLVKKTIVGTWAALKKR